MQYLFDTHAHPQMKNFDRDRDEVLARAKEDGVRMVCVGVDLDSSQAAIELAAAHDHVWASVGLHPNDNLAEVYDQRVYAELLASPRVVAVGEVGLDYYRTPDAAQQRVQYERLVQQLSLARDSGKSLIIHCRDGAHKNAHADMRALLASSEFVGKVRGVVHSFTGTYADAKAYINLGFMIGLNGIITFARQYDDTAMEIPLEYIVLETDSPYLTPEPHRGERNEPAFVRFVAEQLARLRRTSFERVAEQTTRNAEKLFTIPSVLV
ncbi:MAG: TatD family hydrolase [Candidatus Paceibacterota bacterium]|nr:MAG: TatD family hydrolase [Candidatus Paceibacterota bacterium]